MIKARKQDSIIQMFFKKMLIFFSNPTVSLLILYHIVIKYFMQQKSVAIVFLQKATHNSSQPINDLLKLYSISIILAL